MAITVKQRASEGASSSTTVTATFGAGTTAGSVIFVAANTISGGTGITFSDGSSDTYTDSPFGLISTGLNNCSFMRVGAFLTATTGVTTVTASTPGPPSFNEVVAWEVAGLPAGSTWDKHVQTTSATLTTSTAGPSGTLSGTNEICFAYLVDNTATGGATGGWTDTNTFNNNSMQDLIVSTNASVTATETMTVASWDALLWTFGPLSTSIGKRPSTLLLPPSRKMVGWRGLTRLKAYPPAASTTTSLTAYTLAQVKALIQPTGSVPILGRAGPMVKALEQPSGRVPVQGYSEAQVKSQIQPTGTVPVISRAEAQVKALIQPTGTVPIQGRSTAQVKELSQPTGSVGLLGRTETQVKSLQQLFAAFLLRATSTLMVKNILGTPALPLGMSARSEGQVKATDQPSGSVGLSSRAEAMTKSLSSVGFFAGLFARAEAMSKSVIRPSLFTSLLGRTEAQTKERAQPTGAVLLLATTEVQTKALSSVSFGNIAALVGRAYLAVHSALSAAAETGGGFLTGGKQWFREDWAARVLSMHMKKVRSFGR